MSHRMDRIWYSETGTAWLARTMLRPASWVYGLVVAARNAMYDRGLIEEKSLGLPVVSIGNLSAGGTGKTPAAAWMARELKQLGARPAVIMRGYGGDEQLVHRTLNPGIPVFTGADRAQSLKQALATGCDAAVMDDGFQHRRVARTADIVLVSADRWQERLQLLPSGPGREPLSALERATLVVVTRKAAQMDTALSISRLLVGRTGRPVPVLSLEPAMLVDFHTGVEFPLSALQGRPVVVAAGVADPVALERQMRSFGARPSMRVFPDHHAYGVADVASLISPGDSMPVVCTLKDAVKLGPMWPRESAPLWYVSQRCEFDEGGTEIRSLLVRVLAARTTANNQRAAQADA